MHRTIRQVRDKLDSTTFCVFPKKLRQVLEHVEKVEFGLFFFDQFAVQPRCVRNVADKAVQSAHIVINDIQQAFHLIRPLGQPQRPDSRPE